VQWSHQFELLNYSQYGTVVDDVRYACDVTAVSSRSSSRRLSSRQRPSTNSGIDELRQLVAGHASRRDNEESVSAAVKPVG